MGGLKGWYSAHLSQYSRRGVSSLLVVWIIRILRTGHAAPIDAVDHEVRIHVGQPLCAQQIGSLHMRNTDLRCTVTAVAGREHLAYDVRLTVKVAFKKKIRRLGKAAHSDRIVRAYSLGTCEK